jgi:hypothetical protein
MWRWFKSITLLLAGAILLLHNLFPHCHEHLAADSVHERIDLSSQEMEELWHFLVINDMQEGHLEDFYPTQGVCKTSLEFLKSDAFNGSLEILCGRIFQHAPIVITHSPSAWVRKSAGRAPPLI